MNNQKSNELLDLRHQVAVLLIYNMSITYLFLGIIPLICKVRYISVLPLIHNSADHKAQTQLHHYIFHRHWLQFLPPTLPFCGAPGHLSLIWLKSLSCLCLSFNEKVPFKCGQWAYGIRSGLVITVCFLCPPLRVITSFLARVMWGWSLPEYSSKILLLQDHSLQEPLDQKARI